MKKISILLAIAFASIGCTKKVYVQPEVAQIIERTNISGDTIRFDKSANIVYTTPCKEHLWLALDFSGAVVGSKVTLSTPIESLYGWTIYSKGKCFLASAPCSITPQMTQLNMTYTYLGKIDDTTDYYSWEEVAY
jgi:hypothetical protein